MRATVLIADAVGWNDARTIASAKGIGTNVVNEGVSSVGVILVLHLNGNETGRPFNFAAELVDADGHPVLADDGTPHVVRGKDMVATPNPDIPAGSPVVWAVPFTTIKPNLRAGQRYEWRVTIDGEASEDWVASFWVRPAATG